MINTLEQIYDELYNREADKEKKGSEISGLFWTKIFNVIQQYLSPEHDEEEVDTLLYNTIMPFGKANQELGFQRGISHTLSVFRAALSPPKTQAEVDHIYDTLEYGVTDSVSSAKTHVDVDQIFELIKTILPNKTPEEIEQIHALIKAALM